MTRSIFVPITLPESSQRGAISPFIPTDNEMGGKSMSTIPLDYAQVRDDPQRRIIGGLECAVLAMVGILLPNGCFALTFNRYFGGPEFQRGKWFDRLTLVPGVAASWPFAPLLFAATFALAVLIISPHRVAQSWLLRWALYSGAILAAQYTLIQAIAMAEPAAPLSVGTLVAVGGAGITTLLGLGGLWLVPRLPNIKRAYWLPCTILFPLAAIAGWRITLPVILIGGLLVAVIAPALTLAVYLRLVTRTEIGARAAGARGRALRVPFVWLTAFGAAWVVAFINAVELYNSLPKTPPDC